MAKKIVKKKKLRIVPFLLVLLILGVLFFAVYLFFNGKTKNIVIKNTNYLSDDYIIDMVGVKDYPRFNLLNFPKMEKKLEKSPYIEKAKISRMIYHVLVINVVESEPLYVDGITNEVVFSNKSRVLESEAISIFRIPRLINYVPDDKVNGFIKGMTIIKEDILGKISDIEYVPNDYDKDRFLLYMDDGNMVYLTLTKFKHINYYNDVLGQLEGKKGILYLDSGNHFQIKE